MYAIMDRPRPGSDGNDLVDLLGKVAGHDRDALAALYRQTSGKLYGICVRILRNEAEAEEVLQEIYLTVWRKAATFAATRGKPLTWLAVMARNRSIDRIRSRRAPTETIDAAAQIEDGLPSALEQLESAEDSRRLADCLGELDEPQQMRIRAAFVDGATYPELAERESVPLGTMKSWIRRSLLALRGCLER